MLDVLLTLGSNFTHKFSSLESLASVKTSIKNCRHSPPSLILLQNKGQKVIMLQLLHVAFYPTASGHCFSIGALARGCLYCWLFFQFVVTLTQLYLSCSFTTKQCAYYTVNVRILGMSTSSMACRIYLIY